MWPLVRRRNPAAARLLEAMEAEHRAVVPAIEALTAAQRYRSAPADAPREELIQAVDVLTAVLLPHLDREAAEAMPAVARTLTARDWEAWNKQANVRGKPPQELGLEGHWLIDEIDPEGYQVVIHQVPAVPRFILLHGFARPYRRRRNALVEPACISRTRWRFPVTAYRRGARSNRPGGRLTVPCQRGPAASVWRAGRACRGQALPTSMP